jgi:DNA-directed RNA polymerase specialized sigma24 family protein
MANIDEEMPEEGGVDGDLDPVSRRELAAFAEKYLAIRSRLVYFFRRNRCHEPEALADTVLFRVLGKLLEGASTGNSLESYCIGFARHVLQEYWRTRRFEEIDQTQPDTGDSLLGGLNRTERDIVLQRCEEAVTEEDFTVWRRYHDEDREALARELKITSNALRIRVHRVFKAMVAAGKGKPKPEDLK